MLDEFDTFLCDHGFTVSLRSFQQAVQAAKFQLVVAAGGVTPAGDPAARPFPKLPRFGGGRVQGLGAEAALHFPAR